MRFLSDANESRAQSRFKIRPSVPDNVEFLLFLSVPLLIALDVVDQMNFATLEMNHTCAAFPEDEVPLSVYFRANATIS